MKFALVIFETDESRRRIHADRAAYRAEYAGWIGTLAAAGKLVGGDALETEHTAPATVRTSADGTLTVTEGPAHAGEETLGGVLHRRGSRPRGSRRTGHDSADTGDSRDPPDPRIRVNTRGGRGKKARFVSACK
ncbi:YciI family protein [Nocardia sp. NPDC003183]